MLTSMYDISNRTNRTTIFGVSVSKMKRTLNFRIN